MPKYDSSILEGLLRHNFFPRIASDAAEFPPCFTSTKFTGEVARELIGAVRAPKGRDSVQARVTRFNLVTRELSVPHPRPFAELSLFLAEHWEEKLSYLTSSQRSRLQVGRRPDGRIFSLEEGRRKPVRRPVSARFEVKADINNFYRSVYTHAIPWALVGKAEAKKHQHDRTAWFNQFDKLVRMCQKSETSGIAIGPGSSAIIGEVLLQAVDRELSRFSYVRFLDDYSCFADDEAEASEFIRTLATALGVFGLELNAQKTRVLALPSAARPPWVRRLSESVRTIRPKRWRDAADLIDLAIDLGAGDADASTLRYALKVIEAGAKLKKRRVLTEYVEALLQLSATRPVAIPFVCRALIRYSDRTNRDYSSTINDLILVHAKERRSDAVSWLLFAQHRLHGRLSTDVIQAVAAQRDCMSLTLLSWSQEALESVMQIAEEIATLPSDEYEQDRYWLFLYEMQLKGLLTENQVDDPSFVVLAQQGVTFVDMEIDISNAFSLTRTGSGRSFSTY